LTWYDPAAEFAVNAGDTATPCAFVLAMAVLPPPAKVPLAPLEGALNTTGTPFSGFPLASRTVAARGLANKLLILALCGVPPVAVMEAGAPTATMVRLKVAVAVLAVAAASLTWKVRGVLVTAVAGVPLICPVVALRVSGEGSVPVRRDQVYGVVPPVAARFWEYGVPTCPLLSDVVVIVRAAPGALPTVTAETAVRYPSADAVIVDVPALIPFTLGCTDWVWP
jgi:hypothetical protein